MGKRLLPRVAQQNEARIFGLDDAGKPFSIKAQTVDVSPMGARLRGVEQFSLGQTIGLESGGKKSRFIVKWVGRRGSALQGEVGLKNVDPSKQVWALPNQKHTSDDYGPPRVHEVLGHSQVLEWRDNRRMFRRVPLKAGAKVLCAEAKNTGWGVCNDISTTGCFIETMWPLGLHARAELVLRVKAREVTVKAVVRNSRPGWGMGLEFTEVSDNDREFLNELVSTPRLGRAQRA